MYVKLDGNKLCLKRNRDIIKSGHYSYKLWRYKSLVESNSTCSDEIDISLEKSGVYCIEIYGQSKEEYEYDLVTYFTNDDNEKYIDYLHSHIFRNSCVENKSFKYHPPYFDICVIVDKNKCLMESEKRNLHLISDNKYIYYPYEKYKNADIWLSGQVKDNNNNYIDGNDQICIDDLEYMLEGVGCFNICYKFDNCIYFDTDYFSLAQWFYYETSEITIIANRYDLCVRQILEYTDDVISINKEYVKMMLAANSGWNNYLFAEQGIINDVKVLPLGYKMVLVGDKLVLEAKSILNDMKSAAVFDEAMYCSLLSSAKQEIIDNINVILNCNKFSDISMDLTGGIDSRISFAAATKVEDAKKIKIYSAPKNHHRDFSIPLIMANTFGFSYDFDRLSKRAIYNMPIEKFLSIKENFFTGKSLDPNALMIGVDSNSIKEKIIMTGGCGEIISRKYITMQINQCLGEDDNFDINSVLTKNLLQKYIGKTAIGNKASMDAFVNHFLGIIKKTYGDSDSEKIENVSLQYRNRFHFSLSREGGYGRQLWSPNMSKSAFKAFHYSFYHLDDMEVAYDLINEINPLVGAFEYSSSNYNLKRKYPMLPMSDEQYEKCIDEFNINYKKIKMNKNVEAIYSGRYEDRFVASFLKEKCLEELNLLITETIIDNDLGRCLFYFIVNEASNTDIKGLYIKLTAVSRLYTYTIRR